MHKKGFRPKSAILVQKMHFWAQKLIFDARGGPPGDEPMKSLGILGVLGGPWRAGIQFLCAKSDFLSRILFSSAEPVSPLGKYIFDKVDCGAPATTPPEPLLFLGNS